MVAPYGILLVDFTKATAGSESNLKSLLNLKKYLENEMDLAVMFTKRPQEKSKYRRIAMEQFFRYQEKSSEAELNERIAKRVDHKEEKFKAEL